MVVLGVNIRRSNFTGCVRMGYMSDCIYAEGKVQKNGYVYYGHNGISRGAHRIVWIQTYGEIPKGMVIDHICHNEDKDCPGGWDCKHRACINIEHLRMITQRENVLAGKHSIDGRSCPKGHDYSDPRNVYTRKSGTRECAECNRIRAKRTFEKKMGRL